MKFVFSPDVILRGCAFIILKAYYASPITYFLLLVIWMTSFWITYSLLKFLWFSLVAFFSSVLFSASFFLLLLSIFLRQPEEDLVSKALECMYHRSSSIGKFSFLVLFLTCLPHQKLLAFSSKFSIWLQYLVFVPFCVTFCLVHFSSFSSIILSLISFLFSFRWLLFLLFFAHYCLAPFLFSIQPRIVFFFDHA